MRKSVSKVESALRKMGGFASAQELHQFAYAEGAKIGLTTVYRSLQTLVVEKIVDVLRREDGEAIYRICGGGHHHHLLCKVCGRTEEISGEAVEKWTQEIARRYNFRDVGHSAEIFGICANC